VRTIAGNREIDEGPCRQVQAAYCVSYVFHEPESVSVVSYSEWEGMIRRDHVSVESLILQIKLGDSISSMFCEPDGAVGRSRNACWTQKSAVPGLKFSYFATLWIDHSDLSCF